ncbi:MAG: hypothetical protein M3076_18620 [Actinomycetota bacterium]|nr:hypothetical protein [Actinomycetota bacterium]
MRHSRSGGGGRQEGIEALACGVFAAGDEVAVAVPRLADIAVACPGGDLLPVEAGGDEKGDGAVACLVGRDRLEAGFEPCLVRPGADRGGEERLGLGPPEDEVRAVAVRSGLVGHQLAADDEGHRHGAVAGAGLDVDRALDRIPGALDADHARLEVDVRPLEPAELATAETAEKRDRPEGPF